MLMVCGAIVAVSSNVALLAVTLKHILSVCYTSKSCGTDSDLKAALLPISNSTQWHDLYPFDQKQYQELHCT